MKEESERAGLRLNIKQTNKQKLRSWHLAPLIIENRRGKDVVTDLLFLGSKITVDGDCTH